MSPPGTSRNSGDVRLESEKWAKADIDQMAVTNRDFMSTRPSNRLEGKGSSAAGLPLLPRLARPTLPLRTQSGTGTVSQAGACLRQKLMTGVCRGHEPWTRR